MPTGPNWCERPMVAAVAPGSTAVAAAMPNLVRVFVLGIDPGLSRCGYCVLEQATGAGPTAVALGVITTPPADPVHTRLAELQAELRLLFDEYRPGAVAIERVLFQVNVRTAMSVGQASGLAMAEAASRGCAVEQYSPNQVKQAVAGYGGASKEQVQRMVQTLLGLAEVPNPPDAADAAALALCHLAMAPMARAAAAATKGVR
jgi:crossover junction endodeoxyribonuclease RuvC